MLDHNTITHSSNEVNRNERSKGHALAPLPEFNRKDVERVAERLLARGHGCIELRIIGFKQYEKSKPIPGIGFFDEVDSIVSTAAKYHAKAHVYLGVSKRRHELLHRVQPNMIHFGIEGGKAKDVPMRFSLFIDIDANRPISNIASTDGELKAARDVAEAVIEFLTTHGIEPHEFSMSGNGYHIIIDIVSDDVSGGEAFDHDWMAVLLRFLDRKFGSDGAKVDTGTYDIPRVRKLPGTAAIKGSNSTERPWRTATILKSADHPPVDAKTTFYRYIREQSEFEKSTKHSAGENPNQRDHWTRFAGNIATLDILKLADSKGLAPRSLGSGKVSIICPWSSSHTSGEDGDGSTVVFPTTGDKWPGFKCLHAHCATRRLQDFLSFCGPELVDSCCSSRYVNAPPASNERDSQWPPRSSLPPMTPHPPEMTPDLIPEPLRKWCVDEAERIGVPLEFVAVPAVSSLAIAAGRKFCVFPKRFDEGWRVFLSVLWAVIVARPSSKKTPALKAALEPIKSIERRAQADFKSLQKQFENEIKVLNAKIEGIKSAIKTAASKGKDTSSLEIAFQGFNQRLTEITPRVQRYTVQDSTVEKLSEILNQNPRGIGVVVDELHGWFAGMERKGHESSRAFFLKCWDGNTSDCVDRIGRGTITVPATYAVVIGGIQPGKFQKHVFAATSGGQDDDGLVQRFQLMIAHCGQRKVGLDRPIDSVSQTTARSIFKWIVDHSAAEPIETEF